MELMNEIYTSVVDFWDGPIIIASAIFGFFYGILAIRNIIKTYIETGKILDSISDSDGFFSAIAKPHVLEVIVVIPFGMFIPALFLLLWPLVATLAIVVGIIAIPVRRQRQRVLFIQQLKGTIKR